ncbi:MAG: isoleucine--tRNA ligase [Omnitrophica bacterium RBG_13_46_9]|nr:MAG: isoleucine--tRNA ligase [Omnitrophica bacterium RBG_13_46_9]
MDYKDTLNLPKTDFDMKANLVNKEPSMLKVWKDKGIYGAIREKRKGAKKFVLHDGPPYANGQIHMGHVLNKILKDIIVKFYTMKGLDSPFIPGWDCHGLPVEHQLFNELGITKYDINQVEFRKKAKDYAMKYVCIQREEFERLGVFADWGKPYLTLDPKYEAAIVRSFARLVKEGYVYRDLKPVNWCTTCETALAEAEVEYADHKSPSIYVKFRVKEPKGLPISAGSGPKNAYFIIWTTTPWTLLGNVAIAVHPDMDYAVLDVDGEAWVMLEALVEPMMNRLKRSAKVINKIKGRRLEGVRCSHPFIERESVVVLADYVSALDGTGCVHTAPGHGQEDYITGRKYSLPMIMPVNSKGIFDNTCGEFSGLSVHKTNPRMLERLKKENALLFAEEIPHSYPHCWRCKKPIIFRATKQYFVNIDHMDLRKRMLDVIKDDVRWYPDVGQSRISSMVENRPDWCLSRQRYWGVPIVAFKCKGCESVILDHDAIEHVAKIVEKEGSDAWFVKELKGLLPEGFVCGNCGSSIFDKETDIIDVWFESGVSHQAVLKENQKLGFPCQLYLEGSDQHRGWFQSSLITSCAIDKAAPYKSVLTHGFVVDGEGKKMSKSLGNVISPQDVMKKYGADILRLWVASSDYHDDVRLSKEILDRLADAYRKIRNTFRFLLGNIHDFNPKENYVEMEDMREIDRWMLSRLAYIVEDAEKNYSGYMFHKIFRLVYNFCVYEISSLYLDILKDRLYTFGKNSKERRSCQTVLYEILMALLKILAPILSFTTEEAWQALDPGAESVHLSCLRWNDPTIKKWRDKVLDEKWTRLTELRQEVLKTLEVKRGMDEIGSSLEAKVVLYSDDTGFKKFLEENHDNLPSLFIASQVEIAENEIPGSNRSHGLPVWISVEAASGSKCMRCWNYSESVGADEEFKDICSRCVNVIRKSQEE